MVVPNSPYIQAATIRRLLLLALVHDFGYELSIKDNR